MNFWKQTLSLCCRSTRACSTEAVEQKSIQIPSKMKAWRLTNYTGIQALKLDENVATPKISSPGDILIKVEASSVNNLDVMMTKGYGRNFFGLARSNSGESGLPVTLGRDFSGTVVDVGMSASEKFSPGDQVWGAVTPAGHGSHAQYVLASNVTTAVKPKSLSHCEAASFPYIAQTAWSALSLTAGLSDYNNNAKFKVLVIGASGGVGTFAVQLLKVWNYSVVATSKDFDLVAKLGADVVLDYTAPDYLDMLKKLGSFDVILDCAGSKDLQGLLAYLRPWSGAKLVTLSSPALKDIDDYGVVFGAMRSVGELVGKNVQSLTSQGNTLRWAYYTPNLRALDTVSKLIEQGKIKPVINSVFKMDSVPQALEKLQAGSTRGKIVIDMSDD